MQPVIFDLPKSSRRLLNTTRNYGIKKISNGLYHHVGIAHNRLALLDNGIFVPNSIIDLQINVDGLSLFKSSKNSILGKVVGLAVSSLSVIGIYCGENKLQNIDSFLDNFVYVLKEIERSGVYSEKSSCRIGIEIDCFT